MWLLGHCDHAVNKVCEVLENIFALVVGFHFFVAFHHLEVVDEDLVRVGD